ncbi:MAG: hypothetical protein JSV44_07730 [Candidatus Zixiibacteriota bacterium]|nr:MAG: hypothetical protein JSV44_07730 [candidate division Zixibacteria bacterium]
MFGVLFRIRELYHARALWLYLFLLKVFFSFLMIVPLFLVLNAELSTSAFSRSLMNSWDASVLVELLSEKAGIVPFFVLYVMMGSLIYVFVMQFVNGGLYYTVVSGELKPPDWKEFFAECGSNFWSHLKVTLLMVFVYFLLLTSGLFVVNVFGLAGQSLIGIGALVLLFGKVAIVLLIMLAASVFSDAARAAIAAYPDRPFKEVLKIASGYFKLNFTRLAGAYLITCVPFLVVWALAEWLALQAVGVLAGMIGILVEFLLFQLSASARTGQKLWYLIFLGRDFRASNRGRFLPKQVEMNFETN